MLPLIVFVFFISFPNTVNAHDVDREWINNLIQKIEKDKKEQRLKAHSIIENISNGHVQKQEETLSQRSCRANNPTNRQEDLTDRYPKLLVFVSFSMPMESLKVLGKEVNRLGGQIVFRGLVESSFKKTASKLKELQVEAMIDPTLYEIFEIKSVPVFVLLDDPLSSPNDIPPHDRLSGHVTLKYALETFSKGENSQASELLDQLKGVTR